MSDEKTAPEPQPEPEERHTIEEWDDIDKAARRCEDCKYSRLDDGCARFGAPCVECRGPMGECRLTAEGFEPHEEKPTQPAEPEDKTAPMCTECKYFAPVPGGPKCLHDTAMKHQGNCYVGEPSASDPRKHHYCAMQRDLASGCGPEGKHFEPKPKPAPECAACKHCVPSQGGLTCLHETALKVGGAHHAAEKAMRDPDLYFSCSRQRFYRVGGACGPEAKLFEPKPKEKAVSDENTPLCQLTPNACTDCEHCVRQWYGALDCYCPSRMKPGRTNPVTGKTTGPEAYSCARERQQDRAPISHCPDFTRKPEPEEPESKPFTIKPKTAAIACGVAFLVGAFVPWWPLFAFAIAFGIAAVGAKKVGAPTLGELAVAFREYFFGGENHE